MAEKWVLDVILRREKMMGEEELGLGEKGDQTDFF